jgi:hypothetical protein
VNCSDGKVDECACNYDGKTFQQRGHLKNREILRSTLPPKKKN